MERRQLVSRTLKSDILIPIAQFSENDGDRLNGEKHTSTNILIKLYFFKIIKMKILRITEKTFCSINVLCEVMRNLYF